MSALLQETKILGSDRRNYSAVTLFVSSLYVSQYKLSSLGAPLEHIPDEEKRWQTRFGLPLGGDAHDAVWSAFACDRCSDADCQHYICSSASM